MSKYEFEVALINAKGEGYIAGQETRKLIGIVENERKDEHLETGRLPKSSQAIKIRGDQPGWTVQDSLLVDPEDRLLLNNPKGKDTPNTPNRP